MPTPPFFFRGPPLELILAELVFFLIVFTLCITIYYRTGIIYQLTKHKGIFHFRNIFLFFAFAYLFRLIFVFLALSMEFTGLQHNRYFMFLMLPAVGFFSTMAIFSMVATILVRKLRKINGLYYWLIAIALLSSIVAFLTRSYRELVLLQTALFLVAVILVFYQSKKRHAHHLLTQNNITYLLLFLFWILSLFASNRRLIPYEYKIPLYILSAAAFFWIYLRVNKRLRNAKT